MSYFLNAFLLAILSLSSAFAQTRIQHGEHRINDRVFMVSDTISSADRIWVMERNAKKVSTNTSERYHIDERVNLTDRNLVRQVVQDVLKSKFYDLSDERYMMVRLFPDNRGKVAHVEYLLCKDTALTFEELNEMTDRIKAKAVFRIPSDITTDKPLAPIVQMVFFR